MSGGVVLAPDISNNQAAIFDLSVQEKDYRDCGDVRWACAQCSKSSLEARYERGFDVAWRFYHIKGIPGRSGDGWCPNAEY